MKLSPLITSHNKNLFWAFGLVAGSWTICLMITGIIALVSRKIAVKPTTQKQTEKLQQFKSETEFRNYFSQTSPQNIPAELPNTEVAPMIERASQTNDQIPGIDEPDIVKTDGQQIYISSQPQLFVTPMMAQPIPVKGHPILLPPQPVATPTTQIVQVTPVTNIKSLGTIPQQGNLLFSGSTLMVMSDREITGFDVSDPNQPKQRWNYSFADNQHITTARLVNDKVIFVTQVDVSPSMPCPIPLFSRGVKLPVIECTDIWRPRMPINANTTYTVMQLNPTDGTIEQHVSFVGTNGQTVVSVSDKAVYVTFTNQVDTGKLTADVLIDPTNTLVNQDVKDHLKMVLGLAISNEAKQVEIDHVVNQYIASMSDDQRMQWEADRNNQMAAYVDRHKRELETTEIAQIPLTDFNVANMGEVPGQPLNQFSIDEYQNYVRIAVTVGGRGIGGGANSANDVYILDQQMKMVGSVTDLGQKERIYAVRFVGNQGYVVTYQETDPLYVLDLSNPDAPKVTGQLTLSGYSSYLHPLTDTVLLGIGKQDNQVKVSLFDVANPLNPQEMATYQLPDYWSDIQTSHHAFLQDADHSIFFLPTEKGGYIFNYADNGLKLAKTVAGTGINRAVYINDYLYLIGSNKMTVLSEKNWNTTKTIEW